MQHITYHGPYDLVDVPAYRLGGVRRLVPVEVNDEAAGDLLRQEDNYRVSTPEDFEHAAQLAEQAEGISAEVRASEAKRLRALGKAAKAAMAALVSEPGSGEPAAEDAPAAAGAEG